MSIDIKTLIVCNLIIGSFMGVWLLFYRANQKTYPGFDLWLGGTFAFGFGFATMLVRPFLPIWITVGPTNALFILGVLARLDGTALFIHNRRLPKAAYGLIALILAASLFFTVIHDSLLIRALLFSVIASVGLIAHAVLYLIRGAAKVPLYRVSAVVHLAAVVSNMMRAMLWLTAPGTGFFDGSAFQVGYFSSLILIEFCIQLSFVLINTRRTEHELRLSNRQLDSTIASLRATVMEIKTLKGLLPICANCKRVREGKSWLPVEEYLNAKCLADLEPTVCPSCQKASKDS